jgi:hypothetical protein
MKNLVLFLIVIFESCSSDHERSDKQVYSNGKGINSSYLDDSVYEAPIHTVDELTRLKLTALAIDGSDSAYDELTQGLILNGQEDDLFYCSLIVANKFNNREAFYNLFMILAKPIHSRSGIKFGVMDSVTSNLAFYYLFKAYELGESSSKYRIAEAFSDTSNLPKSIYFLEKIMDIEQNRLRNSLMGNKK